MNRPLTAAGTIPVSHGMKAAVAIPRSTLKKKRLPRRIQSRTSGERKKSKGTTAEVPMNNDLSPHPIRAKDL